MTPLMVEIMLWYYTRPTDFGIGETNGRATADATVNQRHHLIDQGLLEATEEQTNFPHYRITEKGTIWVKQMLATPIPTMQYRWAFDFRPVQESWDNAQ